MSDLFNLRLRAERRDRAARQGPELFLHDRAFADCLERLDLVQQDFGRALLIGCPHPRWRDLLKERVATVDVVDAGTMFAAAAGGERVDEDSWLPPPACYDLVVAVGTLDTVNDLARVLFSIRQAMREQAFFIGAMSGGDTLPRLRAAMRAADEVTGAATPHIHPRIEASALAPLLQKVGFVTPVVDIDRVQVSYGSLGKLVGDLRGMAATNLLTARSRLGLSRQAAAAAAKSFADAAEDGRTTEVFESLHFACWTPDTSADHRQG